MRAFEGGSAHARDPDQFIQALLRYVEQVLLENTAASVDADSYLFESGLIDSLKILPLIAFVEDWIGREIPETAIVMANFRSVRTIAARFVSSSPAATSGTPTT